MPATHNLELRGNKWWAHRSIPPSLRPVLGKRNLRKNLDTADLSEAKSRRDEAMAEFAREIAWAKKVKSGLIDPLEARATELRDAAVPVRVVGGASVPEPGLKAALLAEELDNVRRAHGPEAAKRFHAIATAKGSTPLDHHLDRHQAAAQTKAKTRMEQRTAMKRLMAWDSSLTLEIFDGKAAGRYTTESLSEYASPRTKNKHISHLSAYWRWMIDKSLIDAVATNPWTRKSDPIKGRNSTGTGRTERPFTADELKKLLAGNAKPLLHDAMLIAALSGMRREEIALLRVRDCRDNVFDIQDAKTEAGIRKVPIHSGLVSTVTDRSRGKRDDEFLFHELGPAPTEESVRGRGALIGQLFQRYREPLGVTDEVAGKRRSLVNFHSFRRWFVTEAERAGQPPWVIETVVGHARTGMTLGVYSKGPAMEQLKAVVEAVKLPT